MMTAGISVVVRLTTTLMGVLLGPVVVRAAGDEPAVR
jgi:hypothetical protein